MGVTSYFLCLYSGPEWRNSYAVNHDVPVMVRIHGTVQKMLSST